MAQKKRSHIETGQLYGCYRQTIWKVDRSDNGTSYLSSKEVSRILLRQLEFNKREPKDTQYAGEQADRGTY